MTHTDRDRSEPVWPPHARNAYQQPTEPSEREQRYADSMIQFYGDGVVASPEEHRHRFARAVMKVADAEQAELRAEVERLKRERDNIGCSRFTCADDLGRANRAHDAQKERAEAAERALADERAKVARVEAVLSADTTWRCSDCGWVATDDTIAQALWHEADRHVTMVCPECGAEGSFVDHEPAVELLAAKVHEAWMATKAAQGITSRPSEWGEEQMVPYADLSERAKDLDRGTVRPVLDAIRAALAGDA